MPAGGAARGGAAAGGMMAGGGQMANNLMMAAMAAGMLAQSLDGLSEGTKQFIMDLSMIGGMLGMVAMSGMGVVTSMLLSTTTRYTEVKAALASAVAKKNEAREATLAAMADRLKSKAAMASAGMLAGLTIALTYTIMKRQSLGRNKLKL